MYDEHILDQRLLVRVARSDVADATGEHDGFVITTHLAGNLLLETAEITEQIGPTELVVERCPANRSLEHDVQCGGDAIRLTVVSLPRLHEPGNTQMRNGESGESDFGLSADAGRTLIADFTTGTGGRARKRRNRSRMIMRLDFHHRMGELIVRVIMAVGAGVETAHRGPFHDCRIIGVGNDGSLWARLMRMTNHGEQRSRLRLAVDDPVGVEYLMATML